MDDLEKVFISETSQLDRVYVKMHETRVVSGEKLIHVDLGSCVSVVLAGKDTTGDLWIGANHLFKSREEDTDVSLQQIGTLYNMLIDKNVQQVKCIGLFGGGYRERSLAKNVAMLNIRTVLETLSIYNLNIELFQTGFSQAVTIYHSKTRESVIIKHRQFKENNVQFFELGLDALFS